MNTCTSVVNFSCRNSKAKQTNNKFKYSAALKVLLVTTIILLSLGAIVISIYGLITAKTTTTTPIIATFFNTTTTSSKISLLFKFTKREMFFYHIDWEDNTSIKYLKKTY